MALDVSINRIAPDTAVVALAGSFTLGSSLKAADKQIKLLIADGVLRLVLDMQAVTYVDSGGLGALVHAYGLIHKAGGAIRLCGVQDRVVALLRTTHTGEYLPADPDCETSLKALAS